MNGGRLVARLTALARSVWGRNPLRRHTDRIEGATVTAALVLALVSVPVATSVGVAVYHHELVVSAQQTAASRPTTAVLLQDTSITVDPGRMTIKVPVLAQWSSLSSVRHTGVVQASEGTLAGSPVPIWTNAAGAQVNPPLSADQAWARGGLTAMMVLLLTLALLAGAVAAVHWGLNRRRFADLDAEWRQVSPRWTQRA